MKLMKSFLVATLTVLMGLTVTSCLKSDDNNTMQWTSFVKVDPYSFPTSFTDASGMSLVPAQMITDASSKPFAYIYYQFDQTTLTSESKSLNITLLADPLYFDQQYVTTTATTEGNAPIASLEPYTSGGQFAGFFFDKNTLILPIGYKYKKYDKEDDQNKEKMAHSFTMSYDSTDGFSNGKLTLTLNHTVAVSNPEVTRSDNAMDFQAFNISQVLSSLSSTPTQVYVKVKLNENSDDLKTATEKTYEYKYNFKD